MKLKSLLNPHSHSDSSLDGAATVKQVVKRNIELGATHVALTEHGHINSAIDLYTATKDKKVTGGTKISPILGVEAYIENPFYDEELKLYREAHSRGLLKTKAKKPELVEAELQRKVRNRYVHMTIHFKDEWAYKYFCGLSKNMWNRAIKKYDELKPILTLDEVKGMSGHITIGSSCMMGPVMRFLMPSRDGVIPANPARAEYMYNVLREIAGPGNFFVEVFPHTVTHEWQSPEKDKETGRIIKPGHFKANECTCDYEDGDLQKPLNKFVLGLAQKYNDKPLISLDSHFAWDYQKEIQDARLGNGEEGWRFYNSYHIMTTEEAAEKLKATLGVSDKQIEEWVDNSYEWGSLFNNFKLQTNSDRWILHGNSEEFMKKMKSTIDKYGRMDWSNQEMIERLKKEIQVLAYNGKINLLAYFQTVEEIADYCRNNDVLINVRGSAGGSLLLYLIGVSSVNPIKHGLSFERFLTEGRIKANTLPDADLDVSSQEKVIEFLKSKYGEQVCRLSTDTLLKVKSSIKDAERAKFGKVRFETEALCKGLPQTPQNISDHDFVFGYTDETGVEHKGLVDTNPKLKKYAEDNPEIWSTISEMLGIQRQKSQHPCGFVVADKPVTEYFPIIKIGEDWVTGYSPKAIEAAGGVKFDILGLNTLRDIQLCLKFIKERHGITIDPWTLPHDEKCFENFGKGSTETVFQFDTPTVRPYLVKIKPKNIDDLANITALCRPGTLDALDESGRTLADVYVIRSNGKEDIAYIHDNLAPIMKSTFGIQLFQEQSIQIFKDIGGLSNEEAETVRRGIGKKDAKVLAEASQNLKMVCLSKGWNEDQVDLLVKQIMASANYSFNKSHAVSYAYVAYACMWLKTNYKLEWWKATLANASKDEVASKFWRYIKGFTKMPDINLSRNNYEIVGENIIAPLSILNGVGEKAYAQIMSFHPYESLEKFVEVHFTKTDKRSAVHTGIVHKLIGAGVLDSLFEPNIAVIDKLQRFEEIKAKVKNVNKIDPISEEYLDISSLGRYLLKKQLISIYSEDLCQLLLPNRGGKQMPSGKFSNVSVWTTQNGDVVIDGHHLDWIRDIANSGNLYSFKVNEFLRRIAPFDIQDNRGNFNFSVIAYVIDESPLQYKNKTKQATRFVLDVNGSFFEEVMWPNRDMDTADNGFKGLPILVNYNYSDWGLKLNKVIPLIKKEDLKKYNLT